MVTIYGVLKAGAAHVPVDLDAAPQRKQFLGAESGAIICAILFVVSIENMASQLFPEET